MSDLEKLDPKLKRQYSGAYGEFVPGDYGIGDQIPGEGEVIWSFLRKDKLIYVCTGDGFPVEVAASEVKA